MTGMAYRTIDGVPGTYFDCQSGMGMLSTESCAKSYQMAMSPQGLKEGRRIACRACPVGAHHAGVPDGKQTTSRFIGSLFCARCQFDANRLIRGSICVSCYNREREVLIGKNAKGGMPVHGRRVRTVTVACVLDGGKKVRVQQVEKVTGYTEAYLALLKAETSAVMFGWVGGGYGR